MRASNFTVPTMPTLRPKLRKVARRSFSMAILSDDHVGMASGGRAYRKPHPGHAAQNPGRFGRVKRSWL
jgi:hypothetical protein